MMYKYPDNMRRIEEIAAKAKAEGKTYGEYVAVIEPPRPRMPKAVKGKTCERCGGEIINPGKGHRKMCDNCRSETLSKARKAAREKRKNEAAESEKVYHRQCTRCGAEVMTKQMPSKSRNGNLYCTACREELNKIRTKEWRDRQKEKEKKDD